MTCTHFTPTRAKWANLFRERRVNFRLGFDLCSFAVWMRSYGVLGAGAKRLLRACSLTCVLTEQSSEDLWCPERTVKCFLARQMQPMAQASSAQCDSSGLLFSAVLLLSRFSLPRVFCSFLTFLAAFAQISARWRGIRASRARAFDTRSSSTTRVRFPTVFTVGTEIARLVLNRAGRFCDHIRSRTNEHQRICLAAICLLETDRCLLPCWQAISRL